MIAARRPMAIQDFLLVTLSTSVILLAWCPKGQTRQIVQFRSQPGALRTYSLGVDDPRLSDLRHQLAQWSGPVRDRSLTIARWQAEVADFYARRTDPRAIASEVVPVSFTDQQSNAAGLEAWRSQHEFWLQARDSANASIAAAEARLAQARSLSGPPIVLGKVIAASHRGATIASAVMIGFCLAVGFALWTFIMPPIVMTRQNDVPLSTTGRLGGGDFQLALPARWVRVHQPFGVNVRRAVLAVIVALAIGSTWIV